MTRHDFIPFGPIIWLDPDNDPDEPKLLFAKRLLVEILQNVRSVDFSSGKATCHLPKRGSFLVNRRLSFGFSNGRFFRKTGSSNSLRPIRSSMRLVEGLQARVGFEPISSVCCLPLASLGRMDAGSPCDSNLRFRFLLFLP